MPERGGESLPVHVECAEDGVGFGRIDMGNQRIEFFRPDPQEIHFPAFSAEQARSFGKKVPVNMVIGGSYNEIDNFFRCDLIRLHIADKMPDALLAAQISFTFQQFHGFADRYITDRIFPAEIMQSRKTFPEREFPVHDPPGELFLDSCSFDVFRDLYHLPLLVIYFILYIFFCQEGKRKNSELI